jgi:hypothetical protein
MNTEMDAVRAPLAREVHGEQSDHQADEQRGEQQSQPGATTAEDFHRPAGVPPRTRVPVRFPLRKSDAARHGTECQRGMAVVPVAAVRPEDERGRRDFVLQTEARRRRRDLALSSPLPAWRRGDLGHWTAAVT